MRRVLAYGVTWRWRRVTHHGRRVRRAGQVLRRKTRNVAREAWRRQPPTVRKRLKPLAERRNQRPASTPALSLAPTPGAAVPMPRVAVIVASSNRSELLPIALRSIQLQDIDDWECIVVDDASTDDAALVAQSFAAVDSRFRVLVHDEPLGPSAARNTGIANARAEWVCFLDDDDFLLAGSLRARLDALVDVEPDIAGSFCDWVNTDPHVGLEAFKSSKRPTKRGSIVFADLVNGAPFIVSSPIVRRDVLVGLNGFDESLDHAEDADLWFRLLRRGYRFLPVDHVGVAYRRSPRSLVMGQPEAQLEALVDVFKASNEPAPELADRGPMPAVEPLGAAALELSLMPQILRYVALVAVHDDDAAIALGLRHLGPAARRSIDPAAITRELANYVVARNTELDRSHIRRLESRIRNVLEALAPETRTTWHRPSTSAWIDTVRERPLALRPAPYELNDPAAIAHAVAGAVVLLPEARYHVDELGPLAVELRGRGVDVCFMTSPKTIDTARAELGAYTDVVVPFAPADIGRAAAVVSLNDWGPIKELMQIATEHRVPTFAKVEGVQDFDDDDTGRQRGSYRTASVILAQGENDVAALPEKETVVVGSSRLERIWAAPPVEPGDHVLANLNFTYGVLTEHRDRWVASVAEALVLTDLDGLVTRHPAERGDTNGMEVASKPFRYEITRAGALVSRFSTVPFEAMARGVPFVYHNPHGERVPTFTQPLDAFRISRSSIELAEALVEAMSWRDDYRKRAEPFFRRQVDIDPDRSSAARAADVIIERLASR